MELALEVREVAAVELVARGLLDPRDASGAGGLAECGACGCVSRRGGRGSDAQAAPREGAATGARAGRRGLVVGGRRPRGRRSEIHGGGVDQEAELKRVKGEAGGAQVFGAASVFTSKGCSLSLSPHRGRVTNGIAAGRDHRREAKTRPRLMRGGRSTASGVDGVDRAATATQGREDQTPGLATFRRATSIDG